MRESFSRFFCGFTSSMNLRCPTRASTPTPTTTSSRRICGAAEISRLSNIRSRSTGRRLASKYHLNFRSLIAKEEVSTVNAKSCFMVHSILVIAVTVTTLPVGAQQREVPQQAVERIQKEARHELVMLPFLTVFDNLAYKVDGYNVTLLGQVTKPVLKSDAETAVKRIEGVEKVDNQIEVLPLSPMDDRLRQSLYRAIYGYPPLQRYAMP